MNSWESISGDRPRRALRATGGIGPHFVIRLDPTSPGVSAEEFFSQPHLRQLVEDVAHRLDTTEPRVAVSSLQYELAERLWAVTLGAWVTDGLIPDLHAVTYGRSPAGHVRFHLPIPTALERPGATPAETAALVADLVINQLTSAHIALKSVTEVAAGLLWGNAAAALVLVTNTLLGRGEHHHHDVDAISRQILATPPLSGRLDGDIIGAIKRRSCCLYYRTAARRTCGDCPLSGTAIVRSQP
ncbi:(2Fe-2S)-binding protein [[Mycobacterium] wendilense]|uniref:(2Fe-2S)-binding protein n=1 Tax=[Mycobacterium] wendilense TaxID=3064284 RepID=A0ABN9NWS3_9MYCO|nr:(2Fe-2S)-binding protein [Mycolicibacterium sp. MU0050]CAJ1581480.1 (2Fe-2S)-binding protein [Mycolicibacterium sp. MU0050]